MRSDAQAAEAERAAASAAATKAAQASEDAHRAEAQQSQAAHEERAIAADRYHLPDPSEATDAAVRAAAAAAAAVVEGSAGQSQPRARAPSLQRMGSVARAASVKGLSAQQIEEAEKRALAPKPTNGLDLSDPSVLESYVEIIDPLNEQVQWGLFEYRDLNAFQIYVRHKGQGGEDLFASMSPSFDYEAPWFAYGMLPGGKFIFVSYLPDSLPALKKNKIRQHETQIRLFFDKVHAEFQAMDRKGLTNRLFQEAVAKIKR